MEINDLPPELLIHIFYFVPQRELLLCIQHVCNYFKEISLSPELWTIVNYNSIDREAAETLKYLYHFQHYVTDLMISGQRLATVFKYDRKIVLKNVRKLCISYPVTDDLWEIYISKKFLEMFPNVESLSLHNMKSRFDIDVCLKTLTKFNLKSFEINHQATRNPADDSLLSFISTQPNLHHLKLCGHIRVGDGTIARIINDYSQLKMIELCYGQYQNHSNEVFTSYTTRLTLTKVNIISDILDDEGFESLIRRSSCLASLHIEQCSKITNQGLQALHIYGELLQELSISFNDNHGSHSCSCSKTLQLISLGCRRLRYFSARNCNKIIDGSGVSALVKSCKELTTVTLKQCGQITDGMLLQFGNCKMLEQLHLCGKINISLKTVVTILQSSKSLLHFYLNKRKKSTVTNDIRTQDIKSMCSHSHVKWLYVYCDRDVTKENFVRLVEHCTELRHLSLHGGFLTEIDDTFMSELFRNCVFLPNVNLDGQSFHCFDFVKA